MNFNEIRTSDAAAKVHLHEGLTVVGGLDADERKRWADGLGRALRGETTDIELDVTIENEKKQLTPALAKELALGSAASALAVFAIDLPGARADAVTSAPTASEDLAAVEARVASAEARVESLRKDLAEAQRAATAAADTLLAVSHRVDKEAAGLVSAASERLAQAKAAVSEATKASRETEAAEKALAAERNDAERNIADLRRERTTLEAARSELVSRMVETGDPGDPAPVDAALAALRRLRGVKRKPSAQAGELADRWSEALANLAALPQPPQPPEWLVTPALAALHEAREALTHAETGSTPKEVDPAKIEALDRAHREVLEAEQRAMRKGSRMNRRRLETAHEAEQAALAALEVTTYGEYLQRVAPGADSGGGTHQVAAARAALTDAEAVWEELHGGQASPEWTAAKESQAVLRQEAHELLGREVDDDQLDAELRSHLEAVVESGWAEQELTAVLRKAGAMVAEGADVEAVAERWLAEAPGNREVRDGLEAELAGLDQRLATVEASLADKNADAFFGDEGADDTSELPTKSQPPADGGDDAAASDAPTPLELAQAAEREAEAALASTRERLEASEAEQARLGALEAETDSRRQDVDRLTRELQEAQAAVETARAAEPDPVAPVERSEAGGGVDLRSVVGMEAEAYLLARVAALRGVPRGPLPLVVDAGVISGLSDGAARRVLRLLGRLSASMQVVVLGDDEKISAWANDLGDQAVVRSVAR